MLLDGLLAHDFVFCILIWCLTLLIFIAGDLYTLHVLVIFLADYFSVCLLLQYFTECVLTPMSDGFSDVTFYVIVH